MALYVSYSDYIDYIDMKLTSYTDKFIELNFKENQMNHNFMCYFCKSQK